MHSLATCQHQLHSINLLPEECSFYLSWIVSHIMLPASHAYHVTENFQSLTA